MPRAWASPPASPSIATAISMWATAAERFSRSAATARFSSLPPSSPASSAYHLAFDDNGNLYVTGPTTSSFDAVYQIDPHGHVERFLSRPGPPAGTGLRHDGKLYVAASLQWPARHREDHPRPPGFAGRLRAEPRRPRLRPRQIGGAGDQPAACIISTGTSPDGPCSVKQLAESRDFQC